MTTVAIDKRGRVTASRMVRLPLPASVVWGQMRDLRRFIAIDPLHVCVRVLPRPGAPDLNGASLTIPHRLLGIGPTRIGRVLRWTEGRGFVFSDLSRRGMRTGFPHICGYEVTPDGPTRSRLTISARGRWTARLIPRTVVRLWLRWVLWATEGCIRAEFARVAAWRAGRGL